MNQSHYKNILIIKHGSLGDIISSTAAIKSIKDSFEKSNIVILTSNKYKDFMQKSNLVSGILIDNRKGFFLSLKQIAISCPLFMQYDVLYSSNGASIILSGYNLRINLLILSIFDLMFLQHQKLTIFLQF